MIEGIKIATYIGTEKFGLKKNTTYKIEIRYEKKKGYSVFAYFDFDENKDCVLFCPYSSEISIRKDWSFDDE